MSTKPLQIISEEVEELWPEVAPMLERAQRLFGFHLKYSMDDLKQLCIAEQMQLWVSLNDRRVIVATALTSLVVYPQSFVCEVPLIGSEDSGYNWAAFSEVIADWAKANNCTCLEGYGRRGWLRVMKGWTDEGILMRRILK